MCITRVTMFSVCLIILAAHQVQSQPRTEKVNSAGCGDQSIVFGNGIPKTLVAVQGEELSGQVATFQICHGLQTIQYGTHISWGDGEDSGMAWVEPRYQGILMASHTYKTNGVKPIAGEVGAQCYDPNRQPHGIEVKSCGTGIALVYENIPLTAFTLSTTSVKGGGLITGTVTIKEKPVNLGAMVRLTGSGPASPGIPNIIVANGATTVTFDIHTIPVKSANTVPITVYGGGQTFVQSLTVTP